MDKQKQIEEMIGIIQKAVGGCARNWAELISVNLINAGYCKGSETAEKFAERLRQEDCSVPLNGRYVIIPRRKIDEIIKGITEG